MANSEDPLIQQGNEDGGFMPSRIIPLILALVAGGLLAWNHSNSMHGGEGSLAIVLFAPLFLLLGIGGLVDPRLAWAIGPRAQHFPMRIKVIGGFLAVAGLAVSAYLSLGVYHVMK